MFKVNYITSQNYTLVFSLVFPSLTLNTALINVCILLSVYVPWNCVFIKLFYTLSRTCLRPTHKKGMDILSKKTKKNNQIMGNYIYPVPGFSENRKPRGVL